MAAPAAGGGGVSSSLDDILRSAGASSWDASTLNADVETLVRAWCNEKAAPEILPYPSTLLSGLQSMLQAQESAMSTLPSSGPEALHPALAAGYHVDVQRIRFLLAAFLRTRLLKASY